MGWLDEGKAIATGGIFGGGKSKGPAGMMSGYGPVAGLLGMGDTPDNYDADKYLTQGTGNAQGVYDAAMAKAGQGGPDYSNITAPTILRRVDDKATAQQIATPGTIGGAEASDLRAQRLEQAQTAANSPSSAAAQMRAGLGQTASAAMAQAGSARGADRATARRDAMLATQTGGMQAAGTTAALAAQEQAAKQQAYTQALQGVQAGDVQGAQALTQIGAQNQGADLAAQQANMGQNLAYNKMTSEQSLASQQANQAAGLQAYNLGNQASQGYLNSATQAQGAYNQAAGIASGYGTGQNQAATQKQGGVVSALGGLVGGLLSDINAKQDVGTFADQYSKQLAGAYGMEPDSDPYAGVKTGSPGNGYDFLQWKPETPKEPEKQGLLQGLLSDERAKADVAKAAFEAGKASMREISGAAIPEVEGLPDSYRAPETPIWEGGNPDAYRFDDDAKRAVENMDSGDRIDWARRVEPITYRYKPGLAPEDDGGARVGASAQQLESTGPLGQLMVHKDPYSGLRKIDTVGMGLMMGKAALDRADEAVDIAKRKKGGK